MDTWTHGLLDTWTHGHMVTWTHEHIDTWIHGHLEEGEGGRVEGREGSKRKKRKRRKEEEKRMEEGRKGGREKPAQTGPEVGPLVLSSHVGRQAWESGYNPPAHCPERKSKPRRLRATKVTRPACPPTGPASPELTGLAATSSPWRRETRRGAQGTVLDFPDGPAGDGAGAACPHTPSTCSGEFQSATAWSALPKATIIVFKAKWSHFRKLIR